MRRVVLLGASGSIGTQTLDILKRNPSRFELVGFSLGKRVGFVEEVVRDFPTVKNLCVQNEEDAVNLRKKYPNLQIYSGDSGLISLLDHTDADMVVNALVGFVGLVPSVRALELGRILCSANKESLVVGGEIINSLLRQGKGKLIPIDSEHVAIAKLLRHVGIENAERILITASGGSFRDRKREDLAHVTPADALAHPTWSMGAKITIDSATMMNKGFEIIEADVLFGVGTDFVTPVMHRESYVHSIVQGKDGLFYADVSAPDMHGPIEYAVMEGEVPFEPTVVKSLDELPFHFAGFDPKRYPAVGLALESHRRGGNSNAVLNAANEEAVYAFLENRLPFLQIEEEVRYALKAVPHLDEPTLDQLIDTDSRTRQLVREHIKGGE